MGRIVGVGDPREPALSPCSGKAHELRCTCQDYTDTVVGDFDPKEKRTRVRQLNWWSKQFPGLSLAEITADRASQSRDKLAAETFARGKAQKNKKTGELIPPKEYKRGHATVNRYIATLSHLFSFAVKERRLLDRNPVSDIRRKKEPRGRTRFLSDDERAALLAACSQSEWPALHGLVLLAIMTCATPRRRCSPRSEPRCLKLPTSSDTRRWLWSSAILTLWWITKPKSSRS